MRTFKARASDIGRARCQQLATRFGRELRLARMAAGLTQSQLALLAGLSQQVASDTERGDPNISLEVRARLAAGCGHELAWRLYPVASVSLRDSGQLAIAQCIVSAAHPRWTSELERPVAPGDLRAADLLLGLPEELEHLEIERALVDAQAQFRAAQVKREVIAARETRPTRLIIAVPDTRLTRERLAPVQPLFQQAFPVPSREIWHAIRKGHPVRGDGILFVRPDRARAIGLKDPEAYRQQRYNHGRAVLRASKYRGSRCADVQPHPLTAVGGEATHAAVDVPPLAVRTARESTPRSAG